MIKIERTITIHRSVEDVFTYLSDVGHGPQYISGQRDAHKTSAGPMGIGQHSPPPANSYVEGRPTRSPSTSPIAGLPGRRPLARA
jgi:hypothetical protein